MTTGHDTLSRWSLYRHDDAPGVDFSRVKDDPRVMFAHPGGFIAKTRERIGWDEIVELLRAAMA